VAANELLRAGLHVTLYDQGTRTPGGRGLSHRLAASGAVYDHGAQFIRQPADAADRLGALVQEWVTAGAVLRWDARAGHLVGGRFTPSSSVATTTTASHFFADQLCGPQQPQLLAGTASLAQHLARPREGYTLRVNSRVSGLHRDARTGWLVTCATPDGDTQEQFDAVVVSAAQAARPSSPGYVALSGDLPGAVAGHWARIAAVSYLPVFTAMATLPSGFGAFDLAAVTGHPHVWLLARDSSKPGRGRADGRDAWVAVSSPQFAAEAMASQASAQAGTRSRPSREEQVAASQALWTHAAQLLGCGMETVTVEPSQRWSAGFPAQHLGAPSLSDAEAGFAACGDWAHGPGVLASAFSGLSAADAVAARWR
jgi:predicted NAD/FAD-dependent oxidoreductase